MGKLKSLYHQIPSFIRNKYAFAITLFFAWMVFFDNYNLFFRLDIYSDLTEARSQKRYYQEQIERVNADLSDLFSTEASLEKFAREKYFMKRDDEDVFVIMKK